MQYSSCQNVIAASLVHERTRVNTFDCCCRLDSDALVPRTSASNFAEHKHSLVQAMLAVNDLFYLAAPTVASLFREDVALWLDRNEVRYIPKIKLTGESGYDHLFDFVIPRAGCGVIEPSASSVHESLFG